MKKLVIILSMICVSFLNAQDISGDWNWEYDNGKHISEISLISNGSNSYVGNYCSVYYSGDKVDCSDDDTTVCLQLALVSPNVYEGTFQSTSFNGQGQIRITYLSNPTNSIKVEIITAQGEYYLPNDVIFK